MEKWIIMDIDQKLVSNKNLWICLQIRTEKFFLLHTMYSVVTIRLNRRTALTACGQLYNSCKETIAIIQLSIENEGGPP